MKSLACILLSVLVFAACQSIDVYEKTKAFPKHSWSSKDKPSFTFQITDTTALYDIYFVIRHNDAYGYNNIWVKMNLQGPGDSAELRREFKLAENNYGWLGSGMDDIFEHRIPFNEKPAPLKAGTYRFTLQQDMREDPLDNVLNVGVRVQKANQ